MSVAQRLALGRLVSISGAVSLAIALTGQPLALVLLLALACVAGSPFEPASPRSVSPAWPSPAPDGPRRRRIRHCDSGRSGGRGDRRERQPAPSYHRRQA